ncbi:30S ribosomal protein S8 [Candidatus Saccharibacteria bacterium]|nr:30S ribosomal protein S8 [Candidatus Saccharibacteria bacterium]
MTKTTSDPIADMLSRIRNAIAVRKNQVSMPHSNVKEAVAELLRSNNFIDNVKIEDANVGKVLNLTINTDGTNPRITEIKRMSTPGRRVYAGSESIPVVKRGRGIVIVSTSRGMMTGAEAKKQRVGGELICKVY